MIIKILTFIFGNKPSQVFKRVVILVCVVAISIMMILNVGCGFKIGGFHFDWTPADVSIKKDI
jgi:uncharacterized membrane protein